MKKLLSILLLLGASNLAVASQVTLKKAGDSCSNNGQCASNNCGVNATCIGNAPGAPCKNNGECDSNLCSSNGLTSGFCYTAKCTDSVNCVSGLCAADGVSCKYLHCQNDGNCDSNNCSSSGLSSGFCINERCSKDSDCNFTVNGYLTGSGICNTATGTCAYLHCKANGDCPNPNMIGGSCDTSTGLCRGLAAGSPVIAPANCISGKAVNGYCAPLTTAQQTSLR